VNLNPNSLKFKISVLAMWILAAVLIIYSGFLFLSFRFTLYQEFDDTLKSKAQRINNAVISYMDVLGYDRKSFEFAVSRVISQTGEHPHKNKIEKLENLWLGQARPLGLSEDIVVFLNSRGAPLVRSGNFPANLSFIFSKGMPSPSKNSPIFKNVDLGKRPLRAILTPVIYQNLSKDNRYIILVVTSRERIDRILRERLITKAVSIIFILVIASFLSQIFAKRVLEPVYDITRAAKNIDYKDLSFRIKAEHVDVEIQDLVDSLNNMMSRLEKSFKYIAEFSSHVSHELKTPLAILRGESEIALRSEHSPEEYKKIIQSNLEEIKRMTKIIEDLLLLTKLDYQPEVFKFEDFDLVEFFKEIGESTKILADEKKITVNVRLPDKPVELRGDKVHLRRLFFNLINNAVKFTYPNGTIGIHVEKSGGKALISITDTGVGIPKENLQKIFDKFFHYNGVGFNDSPGNGLGLSISQSIAKIHSGEIQVQSAVGQGSTFTVRLPLPPD